MSSGSVVLSIINDSLVTFVFYFYKSNRNQLMSFISKGKYRYEWVNVMRHKITSKLVDKYTRTGLNVWTINQRLDRPSERFHQTYVDQHIPGDQFTSNADIPDGDPNMLSSSSGIKKASRKADTPLRGLHEMFKNPVDAYALHKFMMRSREAIPAWYWDETNDKFAEWDSQKCVVRVTGTSSDSFGRKKDEKRSVRLQNLYVMAHLAHQAIMRIYDRDRLLSEICRIAVEHAGFDMAWVGLIHQHENKLMPAAICRNKEISQEATLSLEKLMDEHHEAIRNALLENRTHICRGSLGTFPLCFSSHSRGVLNLHATETDFFDADVIGIFTEIAHNLSCALERFERDAKRKQTETALAEREKLQSALLSAAPDCIVTIDQYGEIIGFNRAAELAFKCRSEEVLGENFLDKLIAPESHAEVQQNINRFFAGTGSTALNHRLESKAIRSGSSAAFPIELAIVSLTQQNEPCLAAFIRDISREKQVEARQLGQTRILHLIATGVTLREILLEIAQFAETQSGNGLCTILQLNDIGNRFISGVTASLPYSYVSQHVESPVSLCHDACGTAVFNSEPVVVKDISTAPICITKRNLALEHGLKALTSWPIVGKNGKALGTFTLYFRNMTEPTSDDSQIASICTNLASIAIESRISEERMRYLAHYDGLTSLPNRFLFEEYLDEALRHAQRSGNKFALLFVDLDKFKEINDTFGHDTGDQVLREVGTRMRNCLRHTDKIARMGGDEFYILIEDLNESHYAADIAQKLLQEVMRPVVIRGKNCYVSASIGISIYPDDGDSPQTLLKNADKAMYRVKNVGKNGYQFFSTNNHFELTQ